ncbi:hypothetical protein AB6A40_000774 [Gnathostoma spinigerum]|uniref:Uncharacterized protein n=1 Tax=Gnathostoma spinigerum TaxID=75299 RepID=A0ABD6E3R8_9BILA
MARLIVRLKVESDAVNTAEHSSNDGNKRWRKIKLFPASRRKFGNDSSEISSTFGGDTTFQSSSTSGRGTHSKYRVQVVIFVALEVRNFCCYEMWQWIKFPPSKTGASGRILRSYSRS